MAHRIIAISREFGSGGRIIGEKLAKELGYDFYDKELIELAAKKSGLSPEFIENSEEQGASGFLFNLATGAHTNGAFLLQYETPVSDKAFFAQSAVIREVAEKSDCVIVGRCASYILREHPNCVKIFLYAPLDSRLNRAKNEYGMEEKGLGDKLVKIDKARSRYVRYYTGERWDDIRNYDLAVNTGEVDEDGAVKVIRTFLDNLA